MKAESTKLRERRAKQTIPNTSAVQIAQVQFRSFLPQILVFVILHHSENRWWWCRGWLKDKAVRALWNLHSKGLKQLLKSKKKVDVFAIAFMYGPYLSTSLSSTVYSEKQLLLKVIWGFYGRDRSPTDAFRGNLGGGNMGEEIQQQYYSLPSHGDTYSHRGTCCSQFYSIYKGKQKKKSDVEKNLC